MIRSLSSSRTCVLLGALISITSQPSSAADYTLWLAGSTEKVFRNSPPRVLPADGMKLSAARNEHVAGQLVITSGRDPLTNITVELSPLRAGTGSLIPASAFSLLRVEYVYLPVHDRWYPDPMPPWRPGKLPPGKNQPVWVACVVPKGTAPGLYKGSLVISADNAPTKKVPISIEVWNFDLPDDPILRNAFSFGCPAKYEGVEPRSAEHKKLQVRYFEHLLQRRISPNALPYPLDSPQAASYLSDPRLSSFRLPRKPWADPNLIKYLDRKGWLPKAYLRIIDEPKTERRYQKIHNYGRALRKLHPDLKQLVCFNMAANAFARNKTFWELAGEDVRIWCPVIIWFSDPKMRSEAARHAAKGDEIWSYVCCRIAPYPNFLIDGADVETRIVFWMLWRYRITGFLYWGVAAWKQGDPWTNPANNPKYPDRYGDGVLLYPGRTVGVRGPVTSFRLENIRDGIEDYQYLHLLRQACGSDREVDQRIDRLVTDLKVYTHDPDRIEAVRNEIGTYLSRRGPTRRLPRPNPADR